MSKEYYSSGDIFGEWKLIKKIGEGGNAEVWSVESIVNRKKFAIKILKNREKEKLKRFKEEIALINKANLGNIKNIIKIIDYDNSESPIWFVIHIGESSIKFIKNKSLHEKIKLFEILTCGVLELHNIGITHRDIKPDNIIVLSNQLILTDFGLGHRPTREQNWTLEYKRKGLGAMNTMAPEMRRYSQKYPVLDYKPVDVYSLAKTLWIFITNNELGFDGEYIKNSSISLSNFLSHESLSSIEKLLIKSTKTDPLKRPTIRDFYDEIKDITELMNNFKNTNKIFWSDIIDDIFPVSVPKHAKWDCVNDIFKIILSISKVGHYVFYPTGGGNTLGKIIKIDEDNIKLYVLGSDSFLMMKNLILTYHHFNDLKNFDYFRIECDYKKNRKRKYNKGVFLFFSKSSFYNVNQLENKNHHFLSDDDFRVIVEKYISYINNVDLLNL